jgi:putative transposase
MTTICQVAEVSRSSYYAWLKRPVSQREKKNTELAVKLKKLHKESRGIYGAPRLTAQLKVEGHSHSRKRIAHLMRKEGIFGCARKKYRPMNTTQSNHNLPVSPRLFEVENKETLPKGPNQVWVGDQTYIPTGEGWLFLTTMMDVFNRKIVGYHMSEHLRAETVWEATKMAVCQEQDALAPGSSPLIAHSDRGGPYASEYYRQKLKLLGITQSMSRSGNCYDNAYAESFFHTIKVELTHRHEFSTRAEAQHAIQEYIDWYNSKRLHSALGYRTPLEYDNPVLAA